ncbi:MAG: GTP 3',8-cyclase MoaA [Promethearchaeota archaeon]|nr:MAG: GTP 3',8-cyclase MoaA [Candidatus Lokiarchaeota archaeon]
MKDKCNREIKHIRFSVTEQCNYNCIYCDREGFIPQTSALSVEEIMHLCEILANILKVSRIKFTGGEPLCREDLPEILRRVRNLGVFKDISLTTNGYFLEEKAESLKEAGLNRLNMSLSSLNPETYKRIYGRDGLSKVLTGIQKAKSAGLNPIKLNFVVLKGVNVQEIPDMIEFCGKYNYVLQLIQLHERPDSLKESNGFYERYFYDVAPMIHKLEKKAIDVKVRGNMQNRKVLIMPNSAVIETVIPSHEFCKGCTKLRVGCDGNLFGCLYRADLGKNMKQALKESEPLENYKQIIKEVVDTREPYY